MSRQRREHILARLQREGYLSVRQLAHDHRVDTSTIRRDLDQLVELRLVVRSHGGVTLPAEPAETPYDVKAGQHVPEKRAIARAVAELIPHGRSLLVDSGSTTLELARALRHHRGMTVVTNDLRVAAEVANQGDVRLIVLGGELLPAVYTLSSERAVDQIADYHCDYAILGADAVAPDGITNTNSNEVGMKRAMLRAAAQVVVVADSSKFGRTALVRIAPCTDVDLLVTDDGLAAEEATAYPVEICRVPAEPGLTPPRTVVGPEAPRTTLTPALVPDGARIPRYLGDPA